MCSFYALGVPANGVCSVVLFLIWLHHVLRNSIDQIVRKEEEVIASEKRHAAK